MTPSTVKRGTQEYKNLVAVAKMLEAFSRNDAQYVVEDVYFDFGQDWMWTTICRRGFEECQILTPRNWERIMTATTTGEFANIVDEIRMGKYFGDL